MTLRLAPDFALPLEAVTSTFGLLAVRRAGKSNAAAVLAEELFRAKLPFVVIDPKGDWYGLRSSQDGTGSGLPIPIFGGDHGDVPLEAGGGAFLAELIADSRLSCVVDTSAFSEGDKTRFLIDFAERLYRKNREALHVILEEADDYIPQRPFREQARCVGAFERLVKRGGFRGLGVTLISQRSAALNKNVLTQVETLIVLRTTSPQDRKAIEGWIEHQGAAKTVLDSLPSLADGEAWVWSPHFLRLTEPRRVHFRRRKTFDSGATPKATERRREPATLADVDLGAIRTKMAATIERAKAEDPRELRRQVAELKAQLVRASATKPAPPPPAKHVEIPVLTAKQITRLEAAIRKADQAIERLGAVKDGAQTAISVIVAAAKPIAEELKVLRVGPWAPSVASSTPPDRMALHVAPAARPETVRALGQVARAAGRAMGSGSGSSLPIGEARVLTAIAQHHDGVTREQLTVLTGYKRSTRDAYVQRLRERAALTFDRDRILATTAGVAALGADFRLLPTGDALRAYWLDRLPEGERLVLEAIVKGYPDAADREAISEATGYKRSTRDAYLQRLRARRLVETERGCVRASAELFG
jgi:hypothetical protein